jgi:DNA-binding GntR family transcriptional regulator
VVIAERGMRRMKTSAAVVEYVHREIFDGRLRAGDRVDVERIGAALDVSPTPVREALVLLERDGLVVTRVHRAAFVEHFDARTLRADYHVLGLLSGVAVARVALDRDPEVLAQLHGLFEEFLGSAAQPDRWEEIGTEIVRVQHQAGGTPRLLAELRGLVFLDRSARRSERRGHAEILAAHRQVLDAITAGETKRASQARLADTKEAAEQVIGELIKRGVLRPDGTNPAME